MAEDALDRHRDKLEALRAAILDGLGTVPPEVRAAAAAGEGIPDQYGSFVETIHRHAYRVTDEMVAGLGEAGASDDEVFEVSVSAAYGAARTRLDAGLAALRAAVGRA